MSYDLMVFETTAAPKSREDFMLWYDELTKWSEGHDYEDPSVTSSKLQNWFNEMIKQFPPMNGPFASDDYDNPKVTDYCIGKAAIYPSFAWSVAAEAHAQTRELAVKHEVGFFDVSAENGEILFPNHAKSTEKSGKKPWWKFP